MVDRRILITLAGLTLLTVLVTLWISALAPHFSGEPEVSTGELLSVNWWHPVLRLASAWLWLFVGASWAGLGVLWFAAWVGRRTSPR